jgi:uncharacterized membrane protein
MVKMKLSKWIWIIFGLLIVISLGASVYLMFFGPDRIQSSGTGPDDMTGNGSILGILAIVFSLMVMLVVSIGIYRALNPVVVKNGVPAKARVIEVWDTGTTINENPQVRLRLEFRKNDGGVHQCDVKTIISRLEVGRVQPGCTADVKYDPANPDRVELVHLDLKGVVMPGEEIVGRLQNLDTLRDQGLITAEEYKKMREEILKEV